MCGFRPDQSRRANSLRRFLLGSSSSNLNSQNHLDLPRPTRPTSSRNPLSMAPLTSATGTAIRSWTRHQLPAARAAIAVTNQQRRAQSEATSSFRSPFRKEPFDTDTRPTTNIPNFGHYKSKKYETSNRVFQYFMVGSMGMLAAAGAKSTVQRESTPLAFELPNMRQVVNKWSLILFGRVPGQHVRIRRCPGPSQGRGGPQLDS